MFAQGFGLTSILHSIHPSGHTQLQKQIEAHLLALFVEDTRVCESLRSHCRGLPLESDQVQYMVSNSLQHN